MLKEEYLVRRLYRSRTNHIIAGVCGGLAEYLEADPTLVRIVFVLVGLLTGIGLLAYIVMWILIPFPGQEGSSASDTIRRGADEIAERARAFGESMRGNGSNGSRARWFVGVILIGLGAIALLGNTHIFLFRWLTFRTLWPLILVILGLAMLFPRLKGE